MHDLLTRRVRVPPAQTVSETRNPSQRPERVKTTRWMGQFRYFGG